MKKNNLLKKQVTDNSSKTRKQCEVNKTLAKQYALSSRCK